MKTYKADDVLVVILKSHGFIETSSSIDKQKGKKRFKLSKSAQKEIHFNYENIEIFNSSQGQDSTYSLSELDLKILFFYFKLPSSDFKEIDLKGQFRFEKVSERIESIKEEYNDLVRFDCQKAHRNKLKRIIDFYNNIQI